MSKSNSGDSKRAPLKHNVVLPMCVTDLIKMEKPKFTKSQVNSAKSDQPAPNDGSFEPNQAGLRSKTDDSILEWSSIGSNKSVHSIPKKKNALPRHAMLCTNNKKPK